MLQQYTKENTQKCTLRHQVIHQICSLKDANFNFLRDYFVLLTLEDNCGVRSLGNISLCVCFSWGIFPNSSQQGFYTHLSSPHPFIFYPPTPSFPSLPPPPPPPPTPLSALLPFSACYHQPLFSSRSIRPGVLAHSLPDSHAFTEKKNKKYSRWQWGWGEKQAGVEVNRRGWGGGKAGTGLHGRYMIIFAAVCQQGSMIWKDHAAYRHNMSWWWFVSSTLSHFVVPESGLHWLMFKGTCEQFKFHEWKLWSHAGRELSEHKNTRQSTLLSEHTFFI